jgi:hypothetical protein
MRLKVTTDVREALPLAFAVAAFACFGVAFLALQALARFASGTAWWASVCVLAGAPLALIGLIWSWRRGQAPVVIVSGIVLFL